MILWRSWWLDLMLGVMVVVVGLSLFSAATVAWASASVIWSAVVAGGGVFLLGYVIVRARSPFVGQEARSADLFGSAFVVVGIAIGTCGAPEFASLLTVGCPLIWIALGTFRRGIVWNVVLALLVGAGMFVGDVLRGEETSNWSNAVATAVFTMVFSNMIGSLVHAILKWGNERQELLDELALTHDDLRESYQRLIAATPAVSTPAASSTTPTDSPLSARETEVLTLVRDGCTNRDIATRLFISPATVKTHMEHVLRKLGASTRTQAVLLAHRSGLLPEVPSDSDSMSVASAQLYTTADRA